VKLLVSPQGACARRGRDADFNLTAWAASIPSVAPISAGVVMPYLRLNRFRSILIYWICQISCQ
jgi:hypothetical protein